MLGTGRARLIPPRTCDWLRPRRADRPPLRPLRPRLWIKRMLAVERFPHAFFHPEKLALHQMTVGYNCGYCSPFLSPTLVSRTARFTPDGDRKIPKERSWRFRRLKESGTTAS